MTTAPETDTAAFFMQWAESFFKAGTRNLTKEESMAVVGAIMVDHKGLGVDPEIAETGIWQIITKRASVACKLELSAGLSMWLAMNSPNPAIGVMYVYGFKAYAIANQKTKVGMDEWTKIFGGTIPTDQAFRDLWEAQKELSENGIGTNILDRVSFSA